MDPRLGRRPPPVKRRAQQIARQIGAMVLLESGVEPSADMGSESELAAVAMGFGVLLLDEGSADGPHPPPEPASCVGYGDVSAVADQIEVRDVRSISIAIDRGSTLSLLFDPKHALDDRITMEQFIV